MTEQRRNTFEDADLRDILAEIDDQESEIQKIMSSAMGKAAGIRKKIKATKKRAKDDLAIPMGVLVPLLKVRKLDRQRQAVMNDVAEDLVEVFEDASGQFAMFAPVEREVVAEKPWPDDEQTGKKSKRTKADDDAEQAEGAAVVDRVH